MSRHVLLTGFEPFGTHPVNPNESLVRTPRAEAVAPWLESRPATASPRNGDTVWITPRTTRT